MSAALTSMLTGITEPLEFTFLFVAPLLYAIHCVFAGLAYMLMHVFNVGVGMTFSGGLIDMFLFGILQGNAKTSWVWIVVVGIVYFAAYFFLFSFLITKMDLKTPGRDDNEEVKLYRRSDVDARKSGGAAQGAAASQEDALSEAICHGLGGKKNISDVDCCATRLRCTVHNSSLVSDDMLRATGASGVVHKGNGVQIIYGPRVTVVKSNLEDYLETAPDELYEPKAEEKQQSRAASAADDKKAEGKLIKTEMIASPVNGVAADLSEAPDEAFAGRMMGDGAMVIPKEQTVCAPADGEVCFVFDTKHAIGIMSPDNIELLIHVGIDTVSMNGKGFHVHVATGEHVKCGQKLLTFSQKEIKAAGFRSTVAIIVTNPDEHQTIKLCSTGPINHAEQLLIVR